MKECCIHLLRKASKFLLDRNICKSYAEAEKKISQHTGYAVDENIDINYTRLSWDEYFMSLAFLVCRRSPDAQTQHGAVIVDEKNKIVATGYNGFLPGAEDSCMPNMRPFKYQHIIHAEVNAILSAAQDLSRCKIYITGLPCNECLKIIAKANIKKVIVGDRLHKFADGYFELQSLICVSHDITIENYVGSLAQLEGRYISEKSHEQN